MTVAIGNRHLLYDDCDLAFGVPQPGDYAHVVEQAKDNENVEQKISTTTNSDQICDLCR
jgi:hypothetical protein